MVFSHLHVLTRTSGKVVAPAKVNFFAGPAKHTAFYHYADRNESDYMDRSLGVFNRTE